MMHSLRHALRANWPLIAAMFCASIIFATVAAVALRLTHGVFTYAVDDAYIHMSMAKNLARYGVLGVTPFEFTFATSSPLWTALIAAAYMLGGVRPLTPIWTSIALSAVLLVVVDALVRRHRAPDSLRLVALLWTLLCAPLVALVFAGMETVLQLIVDVALVGVGAKMLSLREESTGKALLPLLLVLAAVSTLVRYESLLIVGAIGLFFVLERRWSHAVALSVSAVLPIVAVGLLSIRQGGFFLPNSVLVKTAENAGVGALTMGLAGYFRALFERVQPIHPLWALTILALLILGMRFHASRDSMEDERFVFLLIASATGVFQLLLGDVGWFYRYEAYLVVLLGLGILLQLSPLSDRSWWGSLAVVGKGLLVTLAVVAMLECGLRATLSLGETPLAMRKIFEHQYQTARFLSENPQFDGVAVFDLGAVTFFNDSIRVFDTARLGDSNVPRRLLSLPMSTADMQHLAREDGVDVAVLPRGMRVPESWTPVGMWTLRRNVLATGDIRSLVVYAVPPTDPSAVSRAFVACSSRMPNGVITDHLLGSDSAR